MWKKLAAAIALAFALMPAAAQADAPNPPTIPPIAVPPIFGGDPVDYVSKIPYGVMTSACQSDIFSIRVCVR